MKKSQIKKLLLALLLASQIERLCNDFSGHRDFLINVPPIVDELRTVITDTISANFKGSI